MATGEDKMRDRLWIGDRNRRGENIDWFPDHASVCFVSHIITDIVRTMDAVKFVFGLQDTPDFVISAKV